MVKCAKKNNERKTFADDSETDYDESPNLNHYPNSSVIAPAAAAAIVGNEIINNSQESYDETSGGAWDYTDYGTAAEFGSSDISTSNSYSDSSSSCSSGSSCSSDSSGSRD